MVGPRRDRPRAPCFEQYESRVTLSAEPIANSIAQPPHDDGLELDVAAMLRRLHEQYQLTGGGQTVVVIDSGIAYDHLALGNGIGSGFHVVGGWDFTDEKDSDPYDDGPAGFHGTHVAGIIGSLDPEHMGLAPDADLVGLRVFDDYGHSDFAWIEQALQWVHEHRDDFDHPITTVNLSIGLMPKKQLADAERILDDEFAQLVADGIFVSVAAGNGYDTQPMAGLSYPASSPWVVPVGSVNEAGELSDFTRRDARMLAAPGENINSTITDYLFDFDGVTDDWYAFSGTSQAAPFVAGSAVLVREALLRTGLEQVDQAAIYQVLRETADWVPDSEGATQYARVNLQAAIESILGEVSASRSPADQADGQVVVGRTARPIDLGQIEFEQLPRVDISQGDQWYRLETIHAGWLTVEARFGRGNVDIDIFDKAGNWLNGDAAAGAYKRIDWNVAAQQTYLVRVHGDAASGQLTLANIAARDSAGLMRLEVPADVSVVELTRGDHLTVALDGLTYQFPASAASRFEITVHADDRVQIRTSEASPLAYVRSGRVDVSGTAGALHVTGAMRVDIQATMDNNGQLRLYGSPGDDRFTSFSTRADLQGPDFGFTTQGFSRVYVFAGAGQDVAQLHGSLADEVLVAQLDFVRLSNTQHLDYVEAFERVYAYAGGGLDRAFLYGTAADDSLSGTPDSTRLVSGHRLTYAEAFDRVYATAGPGGLDRAYLHGSASADQFSGRPAESTLSGPGYLQSATGFDRTYAYANPGDGDTAYLYGSPLDDLLTARAADVGLGGVGYHNGTFGFDRVYAQAGKGGTDTARLFGDDGNDRLDLIRRGVRLTTQAYTCSVDAFSLVEAVAGLGGVDYAVAPRVTGDIASAQEYVYERWRLRARQFNWLFTEASDGT